MKPHHFFSRIYINDLTLIMAVLLVSHSSESGYMHEKQAQTFNCSDNLPAPFHETIQFAAQLLDSLGVNSPIFCKLKFVTYENIIQNKGFEPEVLQQISEKQLKFFAVNKKVSNKKIMQYILNIFRTRPALKAFFHVKEPNCFSLKAPTYKHGLRFILNLSQS